jgi:hypothetical protein
MIYGRSSELLAVPALDCAYNNSIAAACHNFIPLWRSNRLGDPLPVSDLNRLQRPLRVLGYTSRLDVEMSAPRGLLATTCSNDRSTLLDDQCIVRSWPSCALL